MKTLYYSEFDKMEISEQPAPVAGPGEVLVKVAACGLCGSELEAFKNHSPRRTPPLILGHEFCGVREDSGQQVVSHSLVPCGQCGRKLGLKGWTAGRRRDCEKGGSCTPAQTAGVS